MTDACREDRRPRVVRRTAAALGAAGVLLAGSACGLPGGSGPPGPIKVMTWAPESTSATNMPGMPAVAQVFAKQVNAEGGINGRKLQVLTCNEGNSAQHAAECAQRAVDAKVTAVIGSYSQFGGSFIPPLETAGIPYLGGYGVSPDEFTSPLSYPVNGGTPTLLAGIGQQLAGDHCRHVALVRPDTAAGDLLPVFLDGALHQRKRPAAEDIRVPEAANDYTAQAERAIGDDLPGDCVIAAVGDHTTTFLDSYRRLDPQNTRLSSVMGDVRQSLVDQTGGALEGIPVTGWYPPADDPRWDAMRSAVRKYAFGDQRIDTDDPGEQTTWIAYTVFRSVARTIDAGHLGADALRRALDRDKAISTGGLTPELSWRFEDALPLRDNSRIVNAAVTYQVVKNGQLVSLHKGFIDVRKSLAAADD